MKILDVGCGDGGFLELQDNRLRVNSWLMENGGEDSYGVDINPIYVERAKSKIANGTRFLVADGRQLPFLNAFFDVIHNSGSLHHMKDYDVAIEEFARVGKRGSILLLSESVDNNLIFATLRRLIGSWRGDPIGSYFGSEDILKFLEEFYYLVKIEYYWRSLISDGIVELGIKEPQISYVWCHMISKVLKFLCLDEMFCSHLVVKAIKK